MYRARHSMFHQKGDYNTVYAFFRSLRPIVEKMNPDRITFVLEGYPKWRFDLLPEYKANRVHHDRDNFREQRKKIVSLIREHMPINIVRHEDYECDDVIANIAWNTDDECIIVSSDTDFLQLSANSNVKIYNPIKKSFIQPVDFDYVSWKSLRGDGSDNIPGFKGIGDKRAHKIMSSKDEMEKFLCTDEKKDLFKKNYDLIAFREIESFFETIENHRASPDWDGLRDEFNSMKFFSITNEKSWKKFVDTFENLACLPLKIANQ
jgi:5'-3' exonuclease